MSMTGGISFFSKSAALFKDEATIAATSNNDDAKYSLSMNRSYQWESVGSDDATQEVITVTFPANTLINRAFLAGHNFKAFTVKYGDAADDFTNVVGMSGSLAGGIDETEYASDTAYYEFSPVTTNKLIITIDTTQTPDAQKTLNLCIPTYEIGTLAGYPDAKNVKLDRNETDQSVLSGLSHIVKRRETFSLSLNMSRYPGQEDIDLFESLFDSEDPFLVWPCGGLPAQFRFSQKGWRARDIFQMQTKGTMKSAFADNVYIFGVDKNLKMVEVS